MEAAEGPIHELSRVKLGSENGVKLRCEKGGVSDDPARFPRDRGKGKGRQEHSKTASRGPKTDSRGAPETFSKTGSRGQRKIIHKASDDYQIVSHKKSERQSPDHSRKCRRKNTLKNMLPVNLRSDY